MVSIVHNSLVNDDVEITRRKEVESWEGAIINYTFEEVNGNTLLTVDVEVNQEFKVYMMDMWPETLNKLKSICES